MREHVEAYEEHLRARGLKPSYIQSILFQLREFFRFLGDQEVSRVKIIAYQHHLKNGAVNHRGGLFIPELVSKRLSGLRGFFRWLTQRRLFLLNPAQDLDSLKHPKSLPRYIPAHEEIKQMIERVPKIGYGLRDRAILELLYSTGIRAGELLALGLYDVDLEEKRVLIRQGKGAKDRVVPLGEKALQALQEYLTRERPRLKRLRGSNALFLTRSGRPLIHNTLNERIRRYRRNPGISPHTLRHACAIEMLKKGADIRHIQELLGHSSLETTQIYTRILPLDLQSVHQKYHPRERKKEKEKGKKEEKKANKKAIVSVSLTTLRDKRLLPERARGVVSELVPILGLERTIATSHK